ncbi:hypothetical protein BC833DRAFT_576253 [Globomyces pollinis-pini]|nr:hypothetical protein BC833DRAFT_576253 [Globomyces pollinis-pini]
MESNFSYYIRSLELSSLLCLLVSFTSPRKSSLKTKQQNMKSKSMLKFQLQYFGVMCLVYLCDWLQGSYMYNLYERYGYSMDKIAILFSIGFTSSAMFGVVVGHIADRFGPKFGCLMYCICNYLSCLSTISSNMYILGIGRVLGGISSSLLHSVFEVWMLSAHKHSGFESSSLDKIFSWSTWLSGLTAVLSGCLANVLVFHFGYVSPFMLSCVCSFVAYLAIDCLWADFRPFELIVKQHQSLWSVLHYILTDRSVLTIGVIQCVFESSMYIFVFLWTPTLASVSGNQLPSGVIFSTLMIYMMLGSLVFKLLKKRCKLNSMVCWIFTVSILSFGVMVVSTNEYETFFAFNLYEFSCGLYFPCIARLRSQLIQDEKRATVMNAFRVPLNLIVIMMLASGGTFNTLEKLVLCVLLNLFGFVVTLLHINYMKNPKHVIKLTLF